MTKTTPPSGEVGEIVARLTKAQREPLETAEFIKGAGYYLVSHHGRSRNSLKRMGLLVFYSVWGDRLTPLGLAVRAHIIGEKAGQP